MKISILKSNYERRWYGVRNGKLVVSSETWSPAEIINTEEER